MSGELSVYAKLLAVVLAFIAPLYTIFACMVVFLLLDTGSAIYLNYKLTVKKHKEKLDQMGNVRRKASCIQIMWRVIDREKFGKTIEKLFAYPIVITAAYVFDTYVLGLSVGETNGSVPGLWSFTNLTFVMIVFLDFKSFLRNMGKATGNELYYIVEAILKKKAKFFKP